MISTFQLESKDKSGNRHKVALSLIAWSCYKYESRWQIPSLMSSYEGQPEIHQIPIYPKYPGLCLWVCLHLQFTTLICGGALFHSKCYNRRKMMRVSTSPFLSITLGSRSFFLFTRDKDALFRESIINTVLTSGAVFSFYGLDASNRRE